MILILQKGPQFKLSIMTVPNTHPGIVKGLAGRGEPRQKGLPLQLGSFTEPNICLVNVNCLGMHWDPIIKPINRTKYHLLYCKLSGRKWKETKRCHNSQISTFQWHICSQAMQRDGRILVTKVNNPKALQF